MLSLENRPEFSTLLDGILLRPDSGAEDRPALAYLETGRPDTIISRRSLRRFVQAYATGLKGAGLKPGQLVVIAHTQNLESIYAFWGAMLIGAIPSMFPTLTDKLDPDIYMKNMSELVRLSGVSLILTTDDFAPRLRRRVACPVVGSSRLAKVVSDNESPTIKPFIAGEDKIAFLQHSSGTTGLQKGVALSHRSVLNQLASYANAIMLQKQDVIVSWLPLYHDMGLIAGFIMPLFQGLPLILMSPFDWVQHPALLFRAIHDYRGTLTWLPNFAYNHCARRIRQRDTDGLSAETMRLFINCSEPVYPESHQLFLERFGSLGVRSEMLSASYAMAENTFAVSQTPIGEQARIDSVHRIKLEKEESALPVPADHAQASFKVSCGPPISGTEVQVVGTNGNVLGEREVGELSIRSDCMLSGYYRRPDLSPFQDGWYLTGDRGYMADGEVYVIGRSKDLIINAGKNIYPQDIEAVVNEVEGVHPGRAVVFGVPDRREGTELIAVVAEVKTVDPAARKQIAADIRRAVVQSAMVTASYVSLVDPKWLIKTSSGKIARSANREKWLDQRASKLL